MAKPPLDITIRPAHSADMPAIMALHTEAFEQADEARIVETLKEDGESLISLIAIAPDSQIIGHIQFFPIEVINCDRPANFAGLGPVSTHPDVQKRGVGSALIREGLAQARTAGIQKVFVLGHPSYYPRFGFEAAETAGFAAAWGGPAFMAIRLNSGGPEFGELIYPQAFSEE